MLTTTTPNAYGPNLLARLLIAKSTQQIDECAKAAWVLNGEGLIDDGEMAYLAPIIEHQRKETGAAECFRSRSANTYRQHCRAAIPPSKRENAWVRRRALAKDCVIPTCLARRFTVGKLAVLAVIARAVIEKGSSNMSLPEIAARAGVGCTTARYAIREAAHMGLISVRENRCNSKWNRPNTIHITCMRWRKWLGGYRKTKEVPGNCLRSTSRATPLRILIPTADIKRLWLSSTSSPPLVTPADSTLFDPVGNPPAISDGFRRSHVRAEDFLRR